MFKDILLETWKMVLRRRKDPYHSWEMTATLSEVKSHSAEESDSNVQQQKPPKIQRQEKQSLERQYHWNLELKDSLIQQDLTSIHKSLLYTKSEKWESEKVPSVLMLNNDRIPACSIWTQIQDLPKGTSCITYIGSWRKFFF